MERASNTLRAICADFQPSRTVLLLGCSVALPSIHITYRSRLLQAGNCALRTGADPKLRNEQSEPRAPSCRSSASRVPPQLLPFAERRVHDVAAVVRVELAA